MAARFILVLCASAVLVQSCSIPAYPSCGCGLSGAGALASVGALANAELAAANSIAIGSGYSTLPYLPGSSYINYPVASGSGGPLSVTVNSCCPTGLSVVSENTIDGVLEVIGSLPVLAAVTLDGCMPSSGAAGTCYSCGNGNVGISSESLAAAGLGNGNAIANNVARAEIASAQLGNAAGFRNVLTNAELASINAGLGINAGCGLRSRPCGCGY